MFGRLCIVAVVATLVNALTLNTPSNVQSGTPFTLTWITVPEDKPIFSVFLDHPTFQSPLSVANALNVNTGRATIDLPSVPVQDGYTLEATAFNNESDVLSETAPFSITAPPSTGSK